VIEFFFCYANYTFLLFWMLVFGDGCEAPGIYFGYWDRVAELHQSWLSGIDLVFLIFVIIVELLQWLFIWTMVSRVHFNLVLKDKNGENEENWWIAFLLIWKQVSDVVPVACRAAADAGIRSVCVTNFR
jgi:hypothetical protein